MLKLKLYRCYPSISLLTAGLCDANNETVFNDCMYNLFSMVNTEALVGYVIKNKYLHQYFKNNVMKCKSQGLDIVPFYFIHFQ